MEIDVQNELQVRRLLADYSDAVWRRDRDAYAATWAKDGEWRVLGNYPKGREVVADFWVGFMDKFKHAWQICHTALLDIGPDRGTGRIYINEIVTPREGATTTSMGIYHDDYIKEDGRWVFARRHLDLIYAGATDFSAPFYETIPLGSGSKNPDPSRPSLPDLADLI